MKIDRTELKRALTMLSRVIDKRFKKPGFANCVRLEAKNEILTLSAANQNQILTTKIPCISDLSVCLPCKSLLDFLKNRGEGIVEIQMDHDEIVTITDSDLRTYRPWSVDPEGFPENEEDPIWDFATIWDSRVLAGALSYVLPAMCRNETKPHIHGVYFDPAGQVVAADYHRIHVAQFSNWLKEPALLSATTALLLQYLLKTGDEAIFARTDDKIKISVGQWTLETELRNEEFPPWRQVVPEANQSTKITINAQNYVEELKQLKKLGIKEVKFVVNEEVSLCSADNSVVVPVSGISQHKGPPSVIGLDLRYLLDALGKSSNTVTLNFSDPLGPFHVVFENGQFAVVMPMRLDRISKCQNTNY